MVAFSDGSTLGLKLPGNTSDARLLSVSETRVFKVRMGEINWAHKKIYTPPSALWGWTIRVH